jgi:hypothetical protein
MRLLFATCLVLVASSIRTLSAAPMFTQCPATGVNTGCEFLITINSDGTVTVAGDTNSPNNGPYDGSEDTLVGVLNNSRNIITSIPLTSSTTIFGFDGDGPCTQTIAPASCPSSAGFPGDSTGYGGPGVTFSAISADKTSGTVNFTGIAPGGIAWFSLEEALTVSQINPGTPNGGPTGMPEPASMLTLAGGLGVLGLLRRFRK